MLRSFVKCQRDGCYMAEIQHNTHLCGMSTHNKFLFKTSAVIVRPQTFINISFLEVHDQTTDF